MTKILHLFFKSLAVCLLLTGSLQALEVGHEVPDFAMPAIKGQPQRLSDYIGQPVMLIWLHDCDGCSEDLIDWQYFAESRADDGLKAFFIWKSDKGNKAPWSRLPVLEYDKNNKEAWWFESEPAVLLINPDGVLDFLFQGDIESQKSNILDTLKRWLKKRQWLKLEGYK